MYDLYELAGDVHGLLDFVAFVLMPSEDDILTTQVALVKSVVGTLPTKSTIVVAMLRKYHGSLMLLPEHTTRIFRGYVNPLSICHNWLAGALSVQSVSK